MGAVEHSYIQTSALYIGISFQIGDFGMPRDIAGSGGGSYYYKSHGGIIPVKWTAPEVSNNRRLSQYHAVY